MPTENLLEHDDWRCHFLLGRDHRCTFPAEKHGLCWLHRPKDPLVTLQRASEIAGILSFIWQFLEWYRGNGDGMRIEMAMTANLEDFREAIRAGDEDLIDDLTAHILGTVVPKFVPNAGVTWDMVRRAGEHVANAEGLPVTEWAARLARGLPRTLREDFRGTRWESGALVDEL
jgi:hypothetical protein